MTTRSIAVQTYEYGEVGDEAGITFAGGIYVQKEF